MHFKEALFHSKAGSELPGKGFVQHTNLAELGSYLLDAATTKQYRLGDLCLVHRVQAGCDKTDTHREPQFWNLGSPR